MTLSILEQKGLFVMNQWKNRLQSKQERQKREQSDREFLSQVAQIKQNLQNARDNFNFVTDKHMMEYYIYVIKAEETKLDYYLSRAKEEHRENLQLFSRRGADAEGGCC